MIQWISQCVGIEMWHYRISKREVTGAARIVLLIVARRQPHTMVRVTDLDGYEVGNYTNFQWDNLQYPGPYGAILKSYNLPSYVTHNFKGKGVFEDRETNVKFVIPWWLGFTPETTPVIPNEQVERLVPFMSYPVGVQLDIDGKLYAFVVSQWADIKQVSGVECRHIFTVVPRDATQPQIHLTQRPKVDMSLAGL